MTLNDTGTDGLIQLFTDQLGISGSSVLFLLAIIISLSFAIGVTIRFKNKVAGVATFFMSLGFFVFIGWVNWILVMIPLIIIAGYMFYEGRQK